MASEGFSLTADRYDQSTFSGRFWRIWELFNPLHLLASEDDLARAKALLAQWKDGSVRMRLAPPAWW